MERRRVTIFSCIGVGHTSTNRPLLAETTVLPLSSIALWCRVALSGIHFHSSLLKEWENHIIIYYALKTVHPLQLLRQWHTRQLVGQHGRAKETTHCLVISVKTCIHVLNCCFSVMFPRPSPNGSLPVVQSWVLNVNYCTPVKHSTTFSSE